MTRSACENAVARGVEFLVNFIEKEEHFREHWFDFVAEFTNIARTADDAGLSARARGVVEELVERARSAGCSLKSDASFGAFDRFAFVLLACEEAGITPVEPRERVEAYARRLTAAVRRVRHQPPVDLAEELRDRARSLVSAYFGLRLGFPLSLSYAEALQRALALRPYYPVETIGFPAFVRQAIVATHVVYTASQYNELRIDSPELLEPERVLMYGSIEPLMDAGECEVLGEYLDALRTCGVPEDDRLLKCVRTYLLSQQNVDGSWSGPAAANSTYKQYHVTLAVVQGLRAYRRLGHGPAQRWITDLLRGGRKQPVGLTPLPAATKPVASNGLLQISWPPNPGDLLKHAVCGRPAIVRQAAHACPAWSRWTDDYLLQRVGEVVVPVEASEDEIFAHPKRELKREPMTIRDYLRGPAGDGPRYYLAQASLHGTLAALLDDVAIDHALPRGLRWEKMLWLSHGDCVTPLHFDEPHNLFVLLRGRKRFTLFAPTQSILLYPAKHLGKARFSLVDVEHPDPERFPLYRMAAEPLVIDLEAGDALLVPGGWWHHVRSFGTSLGVSFWWNATSAPGSKPHTNGD